MNKLNGNGFFSVFSVAHIYGGIKLRVTNPFLFIIAVFLICSNIWTDEYIVDNDNGTPGYIETGTWTTSTSTGYNGGTYRYVIGTSPVASATWTPNIVNTGRYEVYAILRTSANRTNDAPYTIVHAGGSTVVHINQYGTNQIQELYLGEFDFNAGTSGYVRINNNGQSGSVAYIADAMRFITAADNPPSITNLNHTPQYPAASDTVNAIATITDDGTIASARLYYSSLPSGASGNFQAFDDGAHNDGSAGDSVYGAAIPSQPDGNTVTYYFTATDNIDQTTTSSSNNYTVGQTVPREYRCIWADSWGTGFLNTSQADIFVQNCRNNNINTIIVEIRKIGDAYYNSGIEPRATNISAGYDPLGYLISLAHDTSGGKKRIEVHAWFVMHRITTGEILNPQHVLFQHPEYIMLDSTGSSGTGTRFIDPGHPGTVNHNVSVILDCLSNYDIDGINMDYIRYPEAAGEWGYNLVSVARFNAFYGKSGQPLGTDPDWDNWRRECVTMEVKKIYVKSLMVKPGVVVTADTVTWGSSYSNFQASSAYSTVFQDWVGWLQQGIIDYNAIMDYKTNNAQFQGWCNLSLASDDKRGSIIGIAACYQTTVQNSMDQLLYARNAGAAGLNIYDYYSEVNAASPATRTDFYNALKTQVFPTWADPPIHIWKTSPTTGIFEGNLTNSGSPIDHGTVRIDGQPATQVYTDGSGWYAILDVPPGNHDLRFSKTGYTDKVVPANIPFAGDIITVNADFAGTLVNDWENY